jgi:molybdopterin synthase catalytic subunit
LLPGRTLIKVSIDPIDATQATRWEHHSIHGAANIFIGMVRSFNLGRQVKSIHYDCYIPLCERVMREIAEEAKAKWGPDIDIAAIHRHGLLMSGEASVLVMASSKHRDESYRVTRYIIEEIKTRAPIWKKETYVDGESEWVKGHALCQHRKVDHHETGGRYPCGG